MLLKISRSTGNYLVLNLKDAILTHFADPGPNCQVDLRLIDGKEGDDQFRKFLAQAVELEGSPLLADLQDQNAELRQKVAALSERIKQIKGDDLEYDPMEIHLPKHQEAAKPSAEHIFTGESRPWLEGFAACREWRLKLKECEESGDTQEPVRPENPYANRPVDHKRMRAWGSGWAECLNYLVDEMPDPTPYWQKAKG